jgi:hypothetical protein
MSERVHPCGYLFASILVLLTAVVAHAQPSYAPPNEEAPNPFRAGVRFGQLPDGRHWGSTAGVAIAPDGSIWAYDRCGANGCADSALAPIVHFDAAGGFINAFGAGLFVFPHGLGNRRAGR